MKTVKKVSVLLTIAEICVLLVNPDQAESDVINTLREIRIHLTVPHAHLRTDGFLQEQN